MGVRWSHYDEAYKAIFDAAQGIASLETDLTKIEFAYNAAGEIETLVFKKGAVVLFTLTSGYDAEGKVTQITRS